MPSRAPTMIQEIGFALDSPLEGAGFKPSVPLVRPVPSEAGGFPSFRQVDPLRVERDRGFADSLLEESGLKESSNISILQWLTRV